MLHDSVTCQYCGKRFKNNTSLGIHITKSKDHPSVKEYYDMYIKKEDEDTCPVCGNLTKFITLTGRYAKYCSHECALESHKREGKALHDPNVRSKGCKKGGKKVQEILKREGRGFYGPNARKKAHETMKKQEKGFYDPNTGRKGGKKASEVLKSRYGVNNIGELMRDPVVRGKAHETMENKYGVSNSIELLYKRRLNGCFEYNGQAFPSEGEMNCYKMLISIFNGIDTQVKVGNAFIDFYMYDIESFIEYHPLGFMGDTETREEYYNRRRAILDEGGYEEYDLYVFTVLSEVMEWVERNYQSCLKA